jgi:hypothetical protein
MKDSDQLKEIEKFLEEIQHSKQKKLIDAIAYLEWFAERYTKLTADLAETEAHRVELLQTLDKYDDDKIAQNERIATTAETYLRSVERGECKQVQNNDLEELKRAIANLP